MSPEPRYTPQINDLSLIIDEQPVQELHTLKSHYYTICNCIEPADKEKAGRAFTIAQNIRFKYSRIDH